MWIFGFVACILISIFCFRDVYIKKRKKQYDEYDARLETTLPYAFFMAFCALLCLFGMLGFFDK